MGAEIFWLGPVEPNDEPIKTTPGMGTDWELRLDAQPTVPTVWPDEITTSVTCDKHPSALAEFWSPEYGLTFCGHCARYGAARTLALVPISRGE